MTDKVTHNQFYEFFEQMDQSAMFYQRAVMFLATKRVAEMQEALDAQIVQVHQPKHPFRQRAGTIINNLFRRFTPSSSDKRKRKEIPRDVQFTVIDVSPLSWPLDQSLMAKDNIEFLPNIIHPNDEKKGDQSHE